MSESSTQNNLQLWAEGPQICNVDTQMMPHYKIQAVCNHEGCEETIPFTMGLASEMRKHFNEKHRLLCKACKKVDFSSMEDLEEHLKSNHGDSFCSECHATFNLTSALAMHIESPKNSCSVTPQALASALRRVQIDMKDLERQKDKSDPNAVYSPISCSSSSGDIRCSPEEMMFRIRKLKEFRRTLLRAHKEALQETKHPTSPTTGTISVHNDCRCFSSNASSHDSVSSNLPSGLGHGKGLALSSYDLVLANIPSGLGHGKGVGYSSYASSLNSVDPRSPSGSGHCKGIGYSNYASSPNSVDPKSPSGSGNRSSPRLRDDEGRFDQENWEWTCATCMVKFTSLSKLLQHVEAKVKDSWWKSMNK